MEQLVQNGLGKLTDIKNTMLQLSIRHPLFIMTQRTQTSLPINFSVPRENVFSAFHANPDWKDSANGAEIFKKNHCDGLVSIGGGSAIDTAKAIKARLLSSEPDKALAGILNDSITVPHLAVPTTAGTGAQSTPFAVVYHHQKKYSVSHPCLMPDAAILDGELLISLPDYQKKCCMLDALCQSIESYWAKNATDRSRKFASAALKGIIQNKDAYLLNDKQSAQAMMVAANYSGQAIAISKTTAPHAMSYGITKLLGIPHGYACALTLPFVWKHMSSFPEYSDVLKKISSILFAENEKNAFEEIVYFIQSLKLPKVEGITHEQIEFLTRTVNIQRLNNHPVVLSETDIRSIYSQALC